ncbi:MAG: chloride channel protein [Actinobacteria bacterium]|nr:chloride channel protein [Actinomycetota bacterium]
MFLATPPKRTLLLTGLAAVLGVAGGAAAWLLLNMIDLITNFAVFGEFDTVPRSLATLDPGPRLFVAAVAGAFIVSLLAKWAPTIRGHGIPEAMDAIMTKQSRIQPRTAVAKPVSAAVAIGTAAPFGAEGPIIVTGGSLGSLLGQIIKVSPSERKILLACGAAAGMSATFGAPLAAVVLAVELLLFEFSARALVPLIVATSVAGGMHDALFGPGPLFTVPDHEFASLEVLPAFALLGLACGLFAVVVCKGLFAVEGAYRRLPIGQFWHPAIGALGFAGIGFLVPRALGVGYDTIDYVLAGEAAAATAGTLLVAKLVAWWLALGSGTSGGTLAPILLMGASFGSLVGSGLNAALPGPAVGIGLFATVAMGATFGAASRASFASIVFVFELTRDYDIVVPLMLATILADLIFNSLSEHSIMTEKLSRRGLRIGRHYGVDPFTTTQVRQIMSSPVETLSAQATGGEARLRFMQGGHGAFPLVDAHDRVVGILARGDLLRADVDEDKPVSELSSRDVVSVGPDDSAIIALHLMVDEGVEHIPVLDRGRLVGICTRSDLMLVRRFQLDHESQQKAAIPARLAVWQRLLKK